MTAFLLVKKLDEFFRATIDNKKYARKVLPILGGMFIFIFFSNVFGLFLEWLTILLPHLHLADYLRPGNSDLTTTLSLALIIIVMSHIIMTRTHGVFGYIKHYVFHFEGQTIVDKCINVFVGWLHLIGEVIRVLSLSLRLFGNIFAGGILLAIMVYLTAKIGVADIPLGNLLTIPFWLFEMFVALIQTVIFCTLSGVYFKEAAEHH